VTGQQEKIEKILLDRGLVKPNQIERVHQRMEQESRSFDDVLQEEHVVYPEQLAQVQAEVMGLPYIDLSNTDIKEGAMKDISRQAAATYRFFAFDEKNDKLLVAMATPDDFQALEAIRFIAKRRGLIPEIYVASKQAIDNRIGGAAEVQAAIGSALRDFSQEVAQAVDIEGKKDQDIARFVEEAPVTKVVAVIIRHAIEGNASDIHIEPTETELRVRYRIDGQLHTSLLLPKRVHPAIVSRVKILSSLKIDESRLPQDGRFSITSDDRSFDFRVSSIPTVYGEKIALRILDKSKGAPSFEELGLIGPQKKIFLRHIHAPHGIVLISGPTGAGKSTTLFTALNAINSPDVNISTLEDPVEYEVKGVNQTQIQPDIGLTFAAGLRHLLRQDPDILMVGEIRDRDTANLSIHASLTGHLVLSTIHTNDAIGAMPRLVDMGIDPYLITATLRLVVAQRLVNRLCPECRTENPIPPNLAEQIQAEIAVIPNEYKQEDNQTNPHIFYTSPGCPSCHESGRSGRVAIFEVIPISRSLRDAVNSGSEYDKLKDISQGEGHLTMRQDGLLKALAGMVQYEDVLRVTSEAQIT
jgi:type IV pilus assembly protein PilB